jgi:hypothetical protein
MKTLSSIAYARSGDKGSDSNIGIIARNKENYDFLISYLTEEKIKDFFSQLSPKKVVRYELPNLLALNFVLVNVLHGGGSRSLRLDSQGKALGQALLQMRVDL